MIQTAGVCENCKYWAPRPRSSAYGICQLAGTSESGAASSLAYAITDSQPAIARLETAGDFGCIQFEAKE